jgi:3-isopropylmalate/(R)-2-methylmalate dehydratase large subunit
VSPGDRMKGINVDVAFLGSCTNGRFSDLREAARVLEGREVHDSVRALAVPGSQTVREKAEEEGLDEIFRDAGVQWREPGCSMCIAMNGDRIEDGELCVSSSNRNYVGRQGAESGKTVLTSPATLAASIVEGEIADPREVAE